MRHASLATCIQNVKCARVLKVKTIGVTIGNFLDFENLIAEDATFIGLTDFRRTAATE